jgi:Mg2+-importing ATPase
LCLSGALVILILAGHNTAFVVVPSLVFMVSVVALSCGILVLSGRNLVAHWGRFGRLAVVQNSMSAMKEADSQLVRNLRVQSYAMFCQAATFVLDGLTLWMLLRSLGIAASPAHVFASFMIANLVRTIGIVPGGLGTFEATAVLMLKMDGISVAAALSATVLFRVVTFVLPMAPGLWFSRHLVRRHHPHPA